MQYGYDSVPGTVVPEPSVVAKMLLAGGGIARLPDYVVSERQASGVLVRALPALEGDRIHAHALFPSHRGLSAKVRAFMDHIVAHLAPRLVHATTPGMCPISHELRCRMRLG